MSKYGAKQTEIDGIVFDSKLESRYYIFLKEKKKNKEIKDFELQPKFLLQGAFTRKDGKKILPIHYIADFKVMHNNGEIEIVDVKGVETSDFKIKKKMFWFCFPNLDLSIITYVRKRGGWISVEYNEKCKKEEKKKGEK